MRPIDADELKKHIDMSLVIAGDVSPHLRKIFDDLKHLIDAEHTVNAVFPEKDLCKCTQGDYILYSRKWLYEHLEQEFSILAEVSGQKSLEAIPVEWIESQIDKGKWAELVQRWREL